MCDNLGGGPIIKSNIDVCVFYIHGNEIIEQFGGLGCYIKA